TSRHHATRHHGSTFRMSSAKHACPCCGYRTLPEAPPGTYEICPICFWEDDNVQFEDPDFTGGANRVSLKEAQKNFGDFGASERRLLKFVRRPTTDGERDRDWQPCK